MNEDLKQVGAAINLGFAMEDFKQSTVGRFFAMRAQEDMLAGLEALKTVDPHDPKAISRMQNRVAVAENFFVWMAEAIDSGNSAKAAFEEATSTPADSA